MMDAVIAEAKQQYDRRARHLDSKGLSYIPITIGETGWNVVDPRLSFRAHPVNQKMYLDRLTAWAAEGRTGAGPKAVFYFVAFDEPWKQGDDGWGLFNKDRQARYAIQALNANNSPAGSATWVWAPGTYTDADALYFSRRWSTPRSRRTSTPCTPTWRPAPPRSGRRACAGTPSRHHRGTQRVLDQLRAGRRRQRPRDHAATR